MWFRVFFHAKFKICLKFLLKKVYKNRISCEVNVPFFKKNLENPVPVQSSTVAKNPGPVQHKTVPAQKILKISSTKRYYLLKFFYHSLSTVGLKTRKYDKNWSIYS